ncbi:MAG: hypothetical protein DRI95_04645 [Bacteroidetes bacterium]|nr:MAG: hypothetical protein DRI95_04645 [Bacteroidota bacterium]RLD81519.1 MAG: hypothetical protein DRJ07_09195 [Bacteroidota bacterium]
MKKIFNIILFVLSPILLLAQETEEPDSTLGWTYTGTGTLSFSQVSFTNWAAGGDNSVSLNGLAFAGADYKSESFIWENDIIMAYGLLKQGEQEFRKTTDKIELSTKFGYHAAKNWYYSALVGFKSQFSKGYEYDDDAGTQTLVSDFLAPGYLNIAMGMNYKPSQAFTLFLGPISGRATIVTDTTLSTRYGVDANETIRNEFGGTIKAGLNKDIVKNVNLASQLTLFSNYMENPQNIDVDWQILFTMKVNKFLSANINFQFIYDDDIIITDKDGNTGPRLQMKQLFGLGLTYKLE